MAIKSNDKIEASDIQSLKTALSTLFSNRTLSITDVNRAGTSITRKLSDTLKTNIDNVSINQNSIITKDDLMLLLNYCLIINDIPNLTDQVQLENIFKDGHSSSLFDWLTNDLRDATGKSTVHGCRGACVGLCVGSCAATSGGSGKIDQDTYGWGQNQGASANQTSDSGYGQHGTQTPNCNLSCDISCYQGCAGCEKSCSGACYGSCNTACKGCTNSCSGCGQGCYKSCSGACSGGCNSCNTQCGSECNNTCKSGCQTSCQNGCAWNCKDGCYGSTTGGTYT